MAHRPPARPPRGARPDALPAEETAPPRRRRRPVLWAGLGAAGVLAVVLLALAGGALAPLIGHAQETDEAAVIRPVKLAVVEDEQALLRRRFFGRVQARQTVDLAFQVGGEIVSFPVTEGEPLAAGALIAELDRTRLEHAAEQAELQLDQAERALARQERLGPNVVAEAEILDARTAVGLRQSELDQARDQLEDATLVSPFDALVVRRLVANHTTVQAGTAVVRLHDMSELRVDVEVPEVLFRRASADDLVQMYATFAGSDERWPLTLREFEAETADVGQTYTLTLAFEEIPGPWLLPGASTTVVVEARRGAERVIYLPETALVFEPDRDPAVMVFRPTGADTGQVTRTTVEIEAADDGRIRLVSGLEEGAEIVIAGAAQLADGQEVRRYGSLDQREDP